MYHYDYLALILKLYTVLLHLFDTKNVVNQKVLSSKRMSIFILWKYDVFSQYAISQLRIVHSGLHLVAYLDVGNFWN